MDGSGKMTLEEIAAIAGVSKATVSRVINGQPRVGAATRAHIQQIIREQGYEPNSAARALATGRSRTIGLVSPAPMDSAFTNPYFFALTQGIAAACEKCGYRLMLSPLADQSLEACRQTVRSGQVDGLVIATFSVGESVLASLQDAGYPCVLVGSCPRWPDITTVGPDYYHGGTMAAQHLAGLGYKRIAHIAGPPDHPGAADRLRGFLDGLRVAGLTCPERYIAPGYFDEPNGYQGMQQLLALSPRPEAVFCVADLTAVGALRAVREAGLRVPEDVAIVGFDDLPVTTATEPRLTTVRQPIRQIGFLAVTTLVEMLRARAADPPRSLAPQHLVLPVELVVRESCGQLQRFRAERLD